jgi:hypothetical protein
VSDETSKRFISKGTCNFCGQTIAKSSITRHLQSCKARKAANTVTPSGKISTTKLLHLSIEGTYANMFWMHVEMAASAKLVKLDQFLRDIWLECCGHLSQFKIDGVDYVIDQLYGQKIDVDLGFEDDFASLIPAAFGLEFPIMRRVQKPMSKFKLSDLLKPGLKFSYEYDFGSTTELTLKVVGEREAQVNKSYDMQILAHNILPEVICDVCGKNLATHLCMECLYEDKGRLCLSCAKKHPHDHYDMFLPIVNSPRTGECAYTGDAPDSWMFWETSHQ